MRPAVFFEIPNRKRYMQKAHLLLEDVLLRACSATTYILLAAINAINE